MSVVLPIFVVITALIFAAMSRKIFGRLFNPVAVYVAVFTGPLSVYLLLQRHLPALQSKTIIIIYSSIVLFSLGGYVGLSLVGRAKPSIGTNVSINEILIKRMVVIGIIAKLFAVLYDYNIIVLGIAGDLQTFLTSSTYVRLIYLSEGDSYTPSSYIVSAVRFISYLFAGAGIIAQGIYLKNNSINRYTIFQLFLMLFHQIILMSKQALVIEIAIMYSAYYITVENSTNQNTRRARAKYALILFILTLFLSLTVVTNSMRNYAAYASPIDGMNIAVAKSALYLAGPVAGLNEILHTQSSAKYGAYTFRPFFKWLARIGWYDGNKIPNRFRDQINIGVVDLNVITSLGTYYDDFGYLGVLLLPYVLGVLVTYSYFKAHRHSSIASISVYAILMTATFWAFYDNLFIQTYYYLLPFFTMGSYFALRRISKS